MAWSPEALATAMSLPNVFPNPEIFSQGIQIGEDHHAVFLAIVADYLDAGVESGCLRQLTIIDVRESRCSIDITLRIASIINAD